MSDRKRPLVHKFVSVREAGNCNFCHEMNLDGTVAMISQTGVNSTVTLNACKPCLRSLRDQMTVLLK